MELNLKYWCSLGDPSDPSSVLPTSIAKEPSLIFYGTDMLYGCLERAEHLSRFCHSVHQAATVQQQQP